MTSKRCCQRSLILLSLSSISAALALLLALISWSPICFSCSLFSLNKLISSMQSWQVPKHKAGAITTTSGLLGPRANTALSECTFGGCFSFIRQGLPPNTRQHSCLSLPGHGTAGMHYHAGYIILIEKEKKNLVLVNTGILQGMA